MSDPTATDSQLRVYILAAITKIEDLEDYEDWKDFNKGEEYYKITPISKHAKGGGVGNVSYEKIYEVLNFYDGENLLFDFFAFMQISINR